MASNPSQGPKQAPIPEEGAERAGYVYPEKLTPEQILELGRLVDVDGEAYLRWLSGDGPDPCPPERST